ncbi:hypothetical protein [Gordonia sp. FQ]|uniref:hypothetical protein n=1 Tax=Gordonia sp. FQ TaxID=3446634 RepID=UPI003F87A5A5
MTTNLTVGTYQPAPPAPTTPFGQIHHQLLGVVADIENKLNALGQQIQVAPPGAGPANTGPTEYRSGSARYTVEGLRELIQQIDDDPAIALGLATAETSARTAEQQAADTETIARADLSPDGDTAAELRATRYWARTQRVLDTKSDNDLTRAAQALVEQATPTELGTLLQELGTYLTSRGKTDLQVDLWIRERAPEVAAAHTAAITATKRRTVVEHNVAAVRRALAATVTGGHPGSWRTPLPFLVDPDTIA